MATFFYTTFTGVNDPIVVYGGSGYTTIPAVTFSAPQLTGGIAATGKAFIGIGQVVGITVTNRGFGYTSPPTITIGAPGGTGATASANVTIGSGGAFLPLSGETSLPVGGASFSSPQAALDAYVVAGVLQRTIDGVFAGPGVTLGSGPLEFTLLPSGSRTATYTSPDLSSQGSRGVIVTTNVTNAGTGSITIAINNKDPLSGVVTNLLTSTAVVTATSNTLTVYPGAATTANVSANFELTKTYQITITHNNANAITYSVGAQLLP